MPARVRSASWFTSTRLTYAIPTWASKLNLASLSCGELCIQTSIRPQRFHPLGFSFLVAFAPVCRFMTELQYVDLSFVGLSDEHLAEMGHLVGLVHLAADSRLVTDEGIEHLQGMVNLRSLNLYSCRITDSGAAKLRHLPQLRSLEICGGLLTDAGVSRLCHLTNLEYLNLQQNHVTDISIPILATSLRKLKALNLTHTKISGSSLLELARLRDLHRLAVNGCHVSHSSLSRFQSMCPNVVCLSAFS